MERLICPHCDSPRLAGARTPKDVVVVMPCPACSGLVVLFRKKAMALDRKLLEKGTQDERKMHIATIIAEFLEPGLLKFAIPRPSTDDFESDEIDEGDDEDYLETEDDLPPISEKELRDFRRIHLRRLDNPEYFKRHLG